MRLLLSTAVLVGCGWINSAVADASLSFVPPCTCARLSLTHSRASPMSFSFDEAATQQAVRALLSQYSVPVLSDQVDGGVEWCRLRILIGPFCRDQQLRRVLYQWLKARKLLFPCQDRHSYTQVSDLPFVLHVLLRHPNAHIPSHSPETAWLKQLKNAAFVPVNVLVHAPHSTALRTRSAFSELLASFDRFVLTASVEDNDEQQHDPDTEMSSPSCSSSGSSPEPAKGILLRSMVPRQVPAVSAAAVAAATPSVSTLGKRKSCKDGEAFGYTPIHLLPEKLARCLETVRVCRCCAARAAPRRRTKEDDDPAMHVAWTCMPCLAFPRTDWTSPCRHKVQPHWWSHLKFENAR
jgi:hypothetical protein